MACEAEDPVRNGSTYYSAAAAAVVEARRNSEKQITEYDKAVQNMNQLAMNALGFHTTYEDQPDGSRITYLHDKPLLEESQTIYKQTIDGFFISTDGGESYTVGFDKNGNVVVNVLYAIGIVADWIRSGRFEVKKGNKTVFLADVDTGEVRITPDFFELSSGETIESIAKKQAQSVLKGETQEQVFNKLTNDGKSQGVYLQNGNIYVNASYIKSGTLVLGGSNNVNGELSVRSADNVEIGRWGKDGIYVNKGYIYSKTDTTGVSIYGGRMHMTHGSDDVGYIGTNYMKEAPSQKGLVFDLEDTGSYMAWEAKKEASDELFYAKLLYANKTFSAFISGTLYAGCDMDFRNYDIKNAYINGLKVKKSFNIPNDTDCNIYSNIDFHNWEIQNVKINNLVTINGYTPYTGTFQFVESIQQKPDGGYSWTWRTATVKNGVITSI